ncbi:MAG: glutaredoxin family protein [Pseudomonadales bacterium]|nr:glutaredoxin family protein [Pseudomonadales bacterium]
MKQVDLYTTLGCHLCEEARALLDQYARESAPIGICEVEISESESLLSRYGVRIPVIRDNLGRELGWPFDYAALEAFLGEDT